MDWEQLVHDLDECLNKVVAEPEEGAEQDEAEAKVVKAKAVADLNHKLVEVHCKFKSLEDDEDYISPSSSGTALSSGSVSGSVGSPKPLMDANVMGMMLEQCKKVMEQPGKFESHGLASQLLAELAKTDEGRAACMEHDVIKSLEIALKEESETDEGSMEGTVQICRVLGNMCYNSDPGREQVLSSNCLELLKIIALKTDRISQEDPGQRFPVILTGFLLNLCNDNTHSVKRLGEIGFVEIVIRNILSSMNNDAIFNNGLNLLTMLAEDGDGVPFLQKTSNLPEAFNHVLINSTSPEVTETALDLMRSVAELPEMTLALAKGELCSTLVKHIVSRWSTPDFEELRSDACDLVVLILSHDESMQHLYKVDDGKFVKTFLDWLEKDDLQLKVAASLALGNFACNKENCVELMNNNTSKVLIKLLNAHSQSDKDMKLQHALLGALRNLAVTASARKQLLDQGLLEPCLHLVLKLPSVSGNPVIFKLLATLRLVVDGNPDVASQIGTNSSVITKIIGWGHNEIPAFKAESSRLVAALIKQSKSKEVMETIVGNGGLPSLTTMLVSPHLRMLNEALISLALVAITLDEETVHRHLHTDLVINAIKNCLKSSHPFEAKHNAVKLASVLLKAKKDDFVKMLQDLEFAECLGQCDEVKDMPETTEILSALKV